MDSNKLQAFKNNLEISQLIQTGDIDAAKLKMHTMTKDELTASLNRCNFIKKSKSWTRLTPHQRQTLQTKHSLISTYLMQ